MLLVLALAAAALILGTSIWLARVVGSACENFELTEGGYRRDEFADHYPWEVDRIRARRRLARRSQG